MLADHFDRKDPFVDLLREPPPSVVEREAPGRGEPPPSTQGIVARADDLGTGWRERAQAPCRAVTGGKEQERRFGLVELTRHCAHDGFLETFGIGDESQRVPRHRRVCEDVD